MTSVKVFCTRLHVVEASGAIALAISHPGPDSVRYMGHCDIVSNTSFLRWLNVAASASSPPSEIVSWELASWIIFALGAYRGAGGRSETQHESMIVEDWIWLRSTGPRASCDTAVACACLMQSAGGGAGARRVYGISLTPHAAVLLTRLRAFGTRLVDHIFARQCERASGRGERQRGGGMLTGTGVRTERMSSACCSGTQGKVREQ
jgi:hypothetical protein